MITLASEPVETVEKRQSLPSEEAQKSHVAHQAFQFPSSERHVYVSNEFDQTVAL